MGERKDHRAAIAAAASASTRRIIAAAGAIMIAVFMGFATDPDHVIKMTEGIGLAAAVLVDVALVRMFMAPAALTLLGDGLCGPPAASARRRPRRSTARDLLRSAGACSVVTAPVRRATFTQLAPVGLAAAGRTLLAIASGAIAVPDVAGAASDATDSIGDWVYLALPALVFVETTALAGFVIHESWRSSRVAWRPSAVSAGPPHRVDLGGRRHRRQPQPPARPPARPAVPRAPRGAVSASTASGWRASRTSSRAAARRC